MSALSAYVNRLWKVQELLTFAQAEMTELARIIEGLAVEPPAKPEPEAVEAVDATPADEEDPVQ